MGSLRDKIRANTVAAPKKFAERPIEIKFGDGSTQKVIVRQPTVEERGLIMESAASVDDTTKKVKVDVARLQVNQVIALTCVPDENGKATDERAFEEADRESMLKQPSGGGWFDELAKAASELMNVDLDDAKNA